MAPLEADARAGFSPNNLAVRYGEQLGFAPNELFAARLEMLRIARLGPYREGVVKPDDSLLVQPLNDLVPGREETQQAYLLPQHPFTQCFQVPGDLSLTRIDVQISRCRGRRTADRLNWDLCVVTSGRPGRSLAHGSVDVRPVGRNDYVSLAMPVDAGRLANVVGTLRVPTAATNDPCREHYCRHTECADYIPKERPRGTAKRFALVFTLPPECRPDDGVELPLYECTRGISEPQDAHSSTPVNAKLSLKGFVFLRTCPTTR
jgi:hypothetical protein